MTKKVINILKAYKEYWVLWDIELKYLWKVWIINWIWGKDSLLFKYVNKIQDFKYFKKTKFAKLVQDIENWPVAIHDIDYTIWWNILDFINSNLKLSMWLFKLVNWTDTKYKLLLSISVFVATTILWYKYFNWWWNLENQ